MDLSLLEQFLGSSSTQFRLPTLIEEENDELQPLVNIKFNHSRKSVLGINKSYTYTRSNCSLTRSY
jgi:hypothetical protein